MGLSSALATAMSGLRANQAALSIVSSNIANAQTPGYVTQNVNQIELASGGAGSSVQVTGVNRQLDLYVQSQLRTETSGGTYADQMSNILGQLQSVYGTPGGQGTLETALSNFTSSLQAISTSSGSQSAQSVALSAAQTLAQQLNTTTQGIQSLRTNVNQDIGTSVSQANAAMTTIAAINTRLQGLSPTDPEAATLEDQRDNAINTLSQLMDVRAVTDSANQVSVFTNSGVQLVGGSLASTMSFSSPGALSANSLYNTDPTKSGVGSLTIQLPNGATTDLVATNAFSSGQIAADLKLRDQTLVQAQTQVDQLAATLSSSLSDQTTAGTAVTGPPAGFSVDTSSLLPGNTDQPDLYQQRDQHPAADIHCQCGRFIGAAAAERAERQSAGDRGQFFRRHVVGHFAVECGARRQRTAVLQSIRDHAERGRIGQCDGQCCLDHDDDLVVDKRKPATPAIYRRQFALHRRDHRQAARN